MVVSRLTLIVFAALLLSTSGAKKTKISKGAAKPNETVTSNSSAERDRVAGLSEAVAALAAVGQELNALQAATAAPPAALAGPSEVCGLADSPHACARTLTAEGLRAVLQQGLDATVAKRGRPWLGPGTPAWDCGHFGAWVSERRQLANGTLDRLHALHAVVQAASSGEACDPERFPLLDAEEVALMIHLSGSSIGAEAQRQSLSALPRLQDLFVSVSKLAHDMEQLSYLVLKGKLPHCFWRFVKAYISVIDTPLNAPFDANTDDWALLQPSDWEHIGLVYSTLIYFPALPAVGRAVNDNFDFSLARQQYHSSSHGLVVMDGLLSPKALDALLQFTLEATVWFELKTGYIGAYMSQGFANDVVVQLVQELRIGLPDLIGDLELMHMWAFKYNQGSKGIKLHVDDALLNLNFWVVPDTANKNSSSGGMIVYLKEPPTGFDLRTYNSQRETNVDLDAFVASSPSIVIPYRQNRVVMFKSSLLHATDEHDFAPGYENRRVSITLLFGKRSR
mmetsp:Transcript_31585/g.88692  ORF Transcript_31585/g.88692 Transcript_31585/m.88692 type:complete len:508 (+) Transcript_31585:97-1620(+)